MKFVRVRNEAGHEFSEPEGSPLITKGSVTVVERKSTSSHPLPPKFNPLPKKSSPAGDAKKEA